MTNTEPSIYNLMDAVRKHSYFVFGAIFTREDFEGIPAEADSFDTSAAEDLLVQRGNEIIEDIG